VTQEMQAAMEIAQHLAELIAAHGLFLSGKAGLKKGASAAAGWLRGNLPAMAQRKIDAAEQAPESATARADLAAAINAELEARPALLEDLRDLLAETGMTQMVGDDSRAAQNKGNNNTITISG
jgi:hypothetical protein